MTTASPRKGDTALRSEAGERACRCLPASGDLPVLLLRRTVPPHSAYVTGWYQQVTRFPRHWAPRRCAAGTSSGSPQTPCHSLGRQWASCSRITYHPRSPSRARVWSPTPVCGAVALRGRTRSHHPARGEDGFPQKQCDRHLETKDSTPDKTTSLT